MRPYQRRAQPVAPRTQRPTIGILRALAQRFRLAQFRQSALSCDIRCERRIRTCYEQTGGGYRLA